VPAQPTERRLAAILSADVVGYSRLMAEDEAQTVRTLTDYREEIGVLVRQHRGRVVDFTGDNLLAEFPTATDAVSCAVEMQGVLHVRNAALSEERRMEFRVGVHLGEVRAEGERIYGDGVNIAARLEGLAEPGGICISAVVHDEIERKLDLDCDDLGEQTVKNIPKPVRVYRVSATPESEPARPARGRSAVLSVAAVLALLVAGGVLLWSLTHERPDSAAFTVPGFGGVPAVAVLPFDNLSGDPEQEYFADGLAEDLITRLSRWGGFPVIARNSSFTYKGQAVDVQQVGRELGAGYVVEGSVRRSGERVRISAQLIDSTTGSHVWAETYDRGLRDIFAVQDEIIGSIVGSMSPELLRSEQRRATRRDPASLGAYDLTMRGWWHFARFSKEDNARARELFERAIAVEPTHARGWAGLALTHAEDLAWAWTDSPAESRAELARAARACLAQDSELADCYMAMALVRWWKGEGREEIAAAEHAVSLAPSDARAHGVLGRGFALAARSDEAIEHLETAMRLDPKSQYNWAWMNAMTWAHFAAGRYEEALDWARRSVRIKPDNEIGYRGIAASSAQLGRLDEARAAIAEELRLQPKLTLAEVRRQNPATDPDFRERWLEGLRLAGMPEE